MNRDKVKDIILTMAEIVAENRELRERIAYLEETDKWQRQWLADICKQSDYSVKNIVNMLITPSNVTEITSMYIGQNN